MLNSLLNVIFLIKIKNTNKFLIYKKYGTNPSFFYKFFLKFSVFLFFMFKKKPKTNFKRLVKKKFSQKSLYI